MKNINNIIITLFVLISGTMNGYGQSSLKVALKYYSFNNKIPYLSAKVMTKADGKLQPVSGVEMKFYMDGTDPSKLIGSSKTNIYGEIAVVIPKNLKVQWDASPKHIFTSKSEANKDFAESESEIEITKARLILDTTNEGGSRGLSMKIVELKDNGWVPVKDVEVKAGVSRLGGGFLTVSKEESYSTDSAGTVSAEFKRENLPGDEKGNLRLVAKVEDHEAFGNLVTEQIVPWGVTVVKENDFDKRTLYSARFKTPLWLLTMAYIVIGLVWGAMIYLIINIVRIMKMGNRVL